MTDITTGGLRDRLIRDAVGRVLKDGLDALGWFDTGRHHDPVQWRDDSIGEAVDEVVANNTVTVTAEDIPVGEEIELGSTLTEDHHVFYVDFYGGGDYAEDVSRQVIGDVRDILRGKHPSIDRDRPVIDVYDTTQDPVPVEPAFTVLVDRVEVDRMARTSTSRPFEQFWQTCRFELVDER